MTHVSLKFDCYWQQNETSALKSDEYLGLGALSTRAL